MRVDRRLLGGKNTVARVAILGDLEWRKLEEDRKLEEGKLLFVKRLAGKKRAH